MRKEPWVPISLVDKSNDAMHHRVSRDTTRQSSCILHYAAFIHYLFFCLSVCLLSQTHTHTHTQCKGQTAGKSERTLLEWFILMSPREPLHHHHSSSSNSNSSIGNTLLWKIRPQSLHKCISIYFLVWYGTVYIVSMDTKGHGTRKERATTTSREKERNIPEVVTIV